MIRRIGVFIWIAIATINPTVAADSLHDFQAMHRCNVARRLEQILYAGDPAVALNRYLVISIRHATNSYVQCIFHDTNTLVSCEASSGFYARQPAGYRSPPARLAALARLGFDTNESVGNFKIDLSVGASPDFNGLADLMLRALHDGYGARANMELKFNAPFAPYTPATCAPTS